MVKFLNPYTIPFGTIDLWIYLMDIILHEQYKIWYIFDGYETSIK